MPTDQNAACENINRMFFTTVSTKQRKEQLVFDLNAARRRVILLQNELDTLEKMGDVRNLTSSMLEELKRLFPWLHVYTCTETNELVILTVRGDGFLYNMVRIIAGTLIYVSEGRILPEDIPKIIESRDRSLAGVTAKPWGLYLNRVFYD